MTRAEIENILKYCINDIQSAIQQDYIKRTESSLTITIHKGEYPKLIIQSNGVGDEVNDSFYGLVGEDGGYKSIRKSRETEEVVELFWTPNETIQSDAGGLTEYGTQFEFYIVDQSQQSFIDGVLRAVRITTVNTRIEIYDEDNQLEDSIDVNGAMNRRAKLLREQIPVAKYTVYLFLLLSAAIVFVNMLVLNILFFVVAVMLSAQSILFLILPPIIQQVAFEELNGKAD